VCFNDFLTFPNFKFKLESVQQFLNEARDWNLYFFSVSKWDTRIQSLVSLLRIQYPTSGHWLAEP
jgi:hypothetical protein